MRRASPRISSRDPCRMITALNCGILQGEREPRQHLQVVPRRGADQREQELHRLAVQGAEIDRPFQETEGDHGAVDVQDDRIADVRQGDAVADGRRRRRFPHQQQPQDQLAIDALRQRQHLHQGPQGPLLAGVLDVIEDPARFQGLGQAGRRLVGGLQVVQHLQRELDLVRGRPFQQFGAVETVLAVHVLGRQSALLDPPRHGRFRHAEEPGYVANRYLHHLFRFLLGSA